MSVKVLVILVEGEFILASMLLSGKRVGIKKQQIINSLSVPNLRIYKGKTLAKT